MEYFDYMKGIKALVLFVLLCVLGSAGVFGFMSLQGWLWDLPPAAEWRPNAIVATIVLQAVVAAFCGFAALQVVLSALDLRAVSRLERRLEGAERYNTSHRKEIYHLERLLECERQRTAKLEAELAVAGRNQSNPPGSLVPHNGGLPFGEGLL